MQRNFVMPEALLFLLHGSIYKEHRENWGARKGKKNVLPYTSDLQCVSFFNLFMMKEQAQPMPKKMP